MISTEGANAFIKKFLEEHPDKDYWDCMRALANCYDLEYAVAFHFVSNYLSKRWGVK